MIFLLGSLSGCIGNDESMEFSTDESGDSPDVICPNGTNETINGSDVTCATPVAFKAADVSNETLNHE